MFAGVESPLCLRRANNKPTVPSAKFDAENGIRKTTYVVPADLGKWNYLLWERSMKKCMIVSTAALALLAGAALVSANDHHEITGPFATPMDVTKKCLECHEDASKQMMATSHWKWDSATTLR